MNRRQIIPFFGLVLVFVIFGAVRASLAQDTDDIQQGIKAYGTYHGGDIDSVSMTNGSLTLDIPLVSYPQRGKLHLGYGLVYNRKTYMQRTQCIIDTCNIIDTLTMLTTPVTAVSDRGFSTKYTTVPEQGAPNLLAGWYSLVAPDGASHILGEISSTDYETVDGTGLYSKNPEQGTIAYDAEGSEIGPYGMMEDTNGNQINWNGSQAVDSVGRSISYPPQGYLGQSNGAGNCPSGPLPVYGNHVWSVPGPNGGTSTFLFCYAQVNVVLTYNITQGTQTYGNINYLQTLVLPNGTAWTFTYSNDGNDSITMSAPRPE